MINIKLYRHRDCDKQVIDKIIEIKSDSWRYPYESQVKWLNNHITDDDIHYCLFFNDKLIAYLNLTEIKVDDYSEEKCYGIGNVCVANSFKGHGWGKLLMVSLKCCLENENNKSLLLCKDEQVSFYLKSGWLLFKGEVFIGDKKINNNLMTSDSKILLKRSLWLNKCF